MSSYLSSPPLLLLPSPRLPPLRKSAHERKYKANFMPPGADLLFMKQTCHHLYNTLCTFVDVQQLVHRSSCKQYFQGQLKLYLCLHNVLISARLCLFKIYTDKDIAKLSSHKMNRIKRSKE